MSRNSGFNTMTKYKNLLLAGAALGVLAAVGCGTARDYPGQAVPGRLSRAYEAPRQSHGPEKASTSDGEASIPTPPVRSEEKPANQDGMNPIPGALMIAVYAGGHRGNGAAGEVSPQILRLVPTYAWINAYSLSTTVEGEPVRPGSIILAFDPDGVLIGRSVVDDAGRYGVMALYMDDPATPIDEGALPGDAIRFQIDGIDAVATGPDEPIWTANGAVLNVDLKVGGPAN
ncbi:MAG: hypothetical protein HY682_05350 [Chloroflexi bacterium]|nr:hypothetical protein [Chloroflexota bacterium]